MDREWSYVCFGEILRKWKLKKVQDEFSWWRAKRAVERWKMGSYRESPGCEPTEISKVQ